MVTIYAQFDDRPAAEHAAQGSGFVVSREGYILTSAHVVTTAGPEETGEPQEADRVYVGFRDGDRVEAAVRRVGPLRRRGRAEGRSRRARARSGAARGFQPGRRRRARCCARQPFRQRELALGRRRLGDAALDQLADVRLQRRRRDPDRCADHTRELGRPAVRRARPRDRHQRADPKRFRAVRGRRLRDPDQRGQALVRASSSATAESPTPMSASTQRT